MLVSFTELLKRISSFIIEFYNDENKTAQITFLFIIGSFYLTSVPQCRFMCHLGVNPLQEMVRLVSIIVDIFPLYNIFFMYWEY